ncbi:hypothetical protein ZWY2020_021009 [Hordeum vulgare]|nr:hypothetical protein ZWY2020_021009 [Hordeum vulgare]
MDPHIRNLEEEEILEDIIKDGPDVEPAESPSLYLNQDVGMEVERHEDEADGAGDRSNDGEGDSSTDGEAGEEEKSGEASTSRKTTKRGLTRKLDARTHYTFEVIFPTAEPKLPKNAADTFKKQCGVLIRDHVPISVREWNKRKGAADTDYVAERYKDNLWNDLMSHFNLPEYETTGDLICNDNLRITRENWKRIVKEIKEGRRKFTAYREKDLLTLVLGNDEHGGRTRGFGPSYPWWLGFARDQDTYRSRERAKKRQQDEENDKFNQLLARINEQQKQIDELRGVPRQEDPAVDITGAPSKRKSTVAESKAPPDDERRMIEGGPGYPVDGIKESTSCELHQKFKNISMKVAVGQALPSGPDARRHGREIPAGFAKVGVDEIMTGFNDMELDIAGPEDERTLGEVLGGVILWDKNYIKLPGSAPRTTPPPSRRRSPTPPLPPSPPHDVGQHNTSPSRSPPPDLGRPSSPPPAHDTKQKRASKNTSSMISK